MGQELVKAYREMKVYKLAFETAMELYWLLPQMLLEEEDSLGQRLIEASRSTSTLLAEAWETRQYYRSFVAKLNEAEMRIATVQTWLAFAVECGYLEGDVVSLYSDRYGTMVEEISRLIEEATDWSARSVA